MNKVLVTAAVLLGMSAAPSLAADLKMYTKAAPAAVVVSPWDIAFGGSIMSDYNFRGISQSNKGVSGSAYFEPQFNTSIGTFYVGLGALAISWPSGATFGFTDPSAEVDIYGGWRNTFGAFSVDLGAIYYYYPRETFNGFTSDSDFWEIYAKLGYAITPDLSIGANFFYTPDLLNYSESFAATGGQNASALYAAATVKWVTPWKYGDLGAYVSGELGHWWISDSGFIAAGFADPSYTYFNAGVAFTYKALTLDLRYHGTDQSTTDCNNFLLVGPGNGSSNWCNDTFIATIKFDTMLSALK